MEQINLLLVCLIILAVGSVFGVLINFFKGEAFRDCLPNIRLGIIGSSMGAIVASSLPLLPSYRMIVILALTILVCFYFLVGHWMISKGTTPVASAISGYRELPEELEEQRHSDLPAA